jgi:hypothetical protein
MSSVLKNRLLRLLGRKNAGHKQETVFEARIKNYLTRHPEEQRLYEQTVKKYFPNGERLDVLSPQDKEQARKALGGILIRASNESA